MKKTILFEVKKHKGYYVASGVDLAIVSEGKTLDKLLANVKEAVELHFEGEDPKKLGFAPVPSVLINFQILSPIDA